MTADEARQLVVEYPTRLREAEQAAVRMVEADERSTLHRPEPLLAEREREGAVLFKPRSSRARRYWRYGVDAEERVVLAVLETEYGVEEEQLIRYQPGRVELAGYTHPESPKELGVGTRRSDGNLDSWRSSGDTWLLQEQYERDARGVLLAIDEIHEVDAVPERVQWRSRITPEYDPAGRLCALVEVQAGSAPQRIEFRDPG